MDEFGDASPWGPPNKPRKIKKARKCGPSYLRCEAPQPAMMAPEGQVSRQAPQSMQVSASMV